MGGIYKGPSAEIEEIVGSTEILDKNFLKKKAPKKIPINTIFITHSMGLNFFLEMKVPCNLKMKNESEEMTWAQIGPK